MRVPRPGPAAQVGLVAFVAGALAQWWAHRADLVHAYWDAQAHLDIARRVWDATTPGLQMLGTVWLPVPHLLYLPFTLHDPWWWSGLAGGLVGLAAFITIAVATFAVVRAHAPTAGWAWVAAAVVITNPSLLYLQTTAMTEPVLLAFLTASTWALDRWARDRAATAALVTAGVLAALAVGSRYDGWFFAAVAGVGVLAMGHSVRHALRFGAPVAAMVVFWLGYNWHYFGDPLEFQRGAWSAASQQASLAAAGLLPTQGAPLVSLAHFAGAVALTIGPLLGVAAVAALGPAAARAGARFALVLLWSALPFNVLALWAGQSVIALPWTEPAGVLNVRYGVMLLPAAAATIALAGAAIAARHPARARGTLLAVAGLVVAQGAWTAGGGTARIGTLREGLAIRDGDAAQMHASRWLEAHYDRGRVLVAPAVNVSPRTRIPLRDRVHPWTWELGPAALADPAAHVDWVIVDRRAGDDPVTRAVTEAPDFTRTFDRVFAERELEIWRRR